MNLLRINRTLISFAAAFVLACLLMTLRCFAYDYSKITGTSATGADITGYETALQVDVTDFGADPTGKKDSYKAIQKALDFAIDNASDTIQVKVYVPNGRYIVSRGLRVYSNTWLFLEKKATIVRNYDSGRVLCNARQTAPGGYKGERNIIIQGGCFDGNVKSTSDDFSTVRFAHITNLWIKDVEISGNKNGHHLEIGGAKNVTIEDCEFHKYVGSAEKEAIQLDAMNSPGVFVGFEPFDDTPCTNVVIRNNKFYDLMRGIGSHSATVGVYYTDIIIKGNIFRDLKSTALVMYNYKNCIVEDNIMSGVGYGIDFAYMTKDETGNYHTPVAGYSGVLEKLDDNANTIIRNNTIRTAVTEYISSPYAIQIFGRELSGTIHPDYNYRVAGVKITNNTIRAVSKAIQVTDSYGILIRSNNITGEKSKLEKNLISIDESSSILVDSNKISKGKKTAVYITGGKNNTITNNKIKSPGISGIIVSGCKGVVSVSDNRVDVAGSTGIKISEGTNASVVNNIAKGCRASGIVFSSSSGSASQNICKSNGADGMIISESEVDCRTNSFIANQKYGLNIGKNSSVNIGADRYKGNCKGEVRVADSGQALIDAPKNLEADEIYSDNLQLSWNIVPDADGYIIYRRLSGSGNDYHKVGEITAATFVDSGVMSRTKYDYKIVGYFNCSGKKQAGNGSASITVRTKTTIEDSTTDMSPELNYNGRERTQVFNVFIDNTALIPDVDYTVKYSKNTSVGRAMVTITGKGQYCKSKVFYFDIVFSGKVMSGVSKPVTNLSTAVSEENRYLNSTVIVRQNSDNEFNKSDANTTATAGILDDYISVSVENLQTTSKAGMQVRACREAAGQKTYGLWL